jgi:hypothetical protein
MQATPVFYTDEAAFDAAVNGIPVSLTTDSYEDLPQGWVFGPLDRGAYSVTNGGTRYSWSTMPSMHTTGPKRW